MNFIKILELIEVQGEQLIVDEFKQERAELKQKLDEAINQNALIEADFNLLRKQLDTDDEDNASEMRRI